MQNLRDAVDDENTWMEANQDLQEDGMAELREARRALAKEIRE